MSHLSNSIQIGEDNRRQTRIEALKETLKMGSTRRGPAKPAKPSETRKRSPNSKTPNSSSRSKPKGKTVEQPLGQRGEVPLEQGGEITIIWEEQDSSTVAPGTSLPKHLPPNPYLQRRSEDTLRRRSSRLSTTGSRSSKLTPTNWQSETRVPRLRVGSEASRTASRKQRKEPTT